MFVIEVIPLRRGCTVGALTYFSATEYVSGTILTILIRNAEALGIVISCYPVSAAKTALRAATFSLKKLPPQKEPRVLTQAYRLTVERLSLYYGVDRGLLYSRLLPPLVTRGDLSLPHAHSVDGSTGFHVEVLQATRKERFLTYRSLVRETLARSASILIVCPTSIDATILHKELAVGIEDRTICITSTQTKKEMLKAYEALEDFTKTKLIIATAQHALLERHDITVVIMEGARSAHYKERVRPYVDHRLVQKIHAGFAGRRLIYGDLLPRTEEEYLRREESIGTLGETPKRLKLSGAISVIDMNKKKEDGLFSLFSEEVLYAIQSTRKKKKNTYLFAPRRGLAPLVACMDCGYIFRSPDTGAPYSLLRTKTGDEEKRWFVCVSSGKKIRAADTCASCGSWRLRQRGVGIQYVYDEFHALCPDMPLIVFDQTTASTFKKACFLRDTFYATKGSVLLGTAMSLPYLTQSVETSVVVNMDAMLATPTWRLEEENLGTLLSLREVTDGRVFLQTRTAETELFEHVRSGSVQDFYTEELELRKMYNYPPFTVFVHFTWQGNKEEVNSIETLLSSLFARYKITCYKNPTALPSAPVGYALVRYPSIDWPSPLFAELLAKVPSQVRVMINPDRIV